MKKKIIKKIFKQKAYLYVLIFSVIFLLVTISFLKIKKEIEVNSLKEQIKHQAENFSGKYSLVIYEPGLFGFQFSHQPALKIPAASLIKLPILTVALKAVAQGRLDFDQQIVIAAQDIAGGSGIFKRVDLPLRITFQELLSFMVIISDNSATNKVIELLGLDYINQEFKSFGLKDTILARKMMDFVSRKKGFENYTSSRDVVSILKKIYQEKLINQKFSQFARNLLSRQQYNDRIARFLPKETEVAHKTGLEKGVVHDAGIVYGKKQDFIISVLTKKVKNYQEAKEFIAKITEMSYNFLN